MNEKIELRFNEPLIESVDEGLKVSGYVNKTDEWSLPLGSDNRFIEKIEPRTFQRAIDQATNDIDFLAEHDKSKILSSTKNGSLVLREDEKGLYMEATISNTSWGKDYHQLIKDGLIQNMSFGMQVIKDKWEKGKQYAERTISELRLFEISCVKAPAYIQSTITARSIDIVSADESFFNAKNQTKTTEEPKMNLKSIAEQRAQLDAQEAELRGVSVQTQETRATQNVLSNEEMEKRAVEQFMRKHDGEEIRALQTNTAPGSLTIPTTLSNHIVEQLSEQAPLFARTRNFTPVNGFLEILREESIGSGGFVGEMQNVTANDFTLNKIRLDQKRVGSAVELSQHLVNDSGIDVVNYAVNILGRRLARTIDNSILIGDKATQFEGVMIDPGNSIERIETKEVGKISEDDLLKLFNSLNPELQNDAVFVMHRSTFNEVAELKKADGNYYMVRDIVMDKPIYKLFGQPVLINNAMPPFREGLKAVLLANFNEGYATMTKKGLNLQHISNDTQQAMRGSHLLLLDGYMDGKILSPNALKVLYVTPTTKSIEEKSVETKTVKTKA